MRDARSTRGGSATRERSIRSRRGLLVLLVGHATRLLPHLNGEPKVYHATIAFGAETDTDDVTGSVMRTAELPDVARVREAMHSPHRRASTKCRRRIRQSRSKDDARTQRRAAANRWRSRLSALPCTGGTFVSCRASGWTPTITCGGGTYIRALARDLGRSSGSAAHLSASEKSAKRAVRRCGRGHRRDAARWRGDSAAGACRSSASPTVSLSADRCCSR